MNSASVSGRVTDPQGAVVPGAQVSARQTETNVIRETVTDQDGRFRFPYLKVGRYEITVRLQGFADATRALTLTIGSAFELPMTLRVGTLDTSVTVSAEATVLEAARSQIAGTVSQAEVQNLPMNGRNFLDLALLVPGVSPTNVASTQLFAETSAVPGGGLSVGSQRNLSNNFIVDGLSANDDAAALSGSPYGVDAVDQFQVVTSGGQAELGRALGGYFNVVTKSGTNLNRGDLYGYFRDDSLNAENPLIKQTLPMNQQQVGASIGGPIAKDRTFYFTNVEWRNLDQTGLTTILEENVAPINGRLAATGYPGAPVTTGIYPNPVKSTHYLGKIDHQLGRSDQFSVRYSLYDMSAQNSRGAGGLSAPSASSALDNLDQTVAFSNTWTLSPRTVNETRAQVAHGDLQAPPTDLIGPAVSIAGVATFGTLSSSPTRRVNTMYEIVNNLSHQAGAHALRAGIDILYNDDTITFPRSIRGSYSFSSLANFLAGTYTNTGFTQTFGTTVVSQTNPNVGLYAQDEWKIAPSLTLNAGLRYDLQYLQTIRTDRNNVSPRAGVAWTPFASRRTIVRGSGGLFFDRVPLRALANALLSANNTSDVANLRQISIVLAPAQAGAPVFPNILAAPVPSVTLPNLTTMNPAMQNAYSRQASVEVEQQIGERGTVSAGYQYTGGAPAHHLDQPERADLRRRRHQQRLPAESGLRQQQPVLARRRVQLSRAAPLVRAAAGALGTVPRLVHLLEGHGERRGVLLQLADRSVRSLEGLGPIGQRSAAPSGGERLRHGVWIPDQRPRPGVLGAAAEHHVRRDDAAGDRGPSDRRRRVHPEKCRHRPGLLQHQPSSEPHVQGERSRADRRAGRGLQPDQSHERRDAERQLRPRRLPDESLVVFRAGPRPSANRGPLNSVCA